MQKKPPHREFESTFVLLSPEQRKAELSVYEIIFGSQSQTKPDTPRKAVRRTKITVARRKNRIP